jgi:hypothetical protein
MSSLLNIFCIITIQFFSRFISVNKDLLWDTYGKYIINNLKRKYNNPILFPIPDKSGNVEYLNKMYSLQEVIF